MSKRGGIEDVVGELEQLGEQGVDLNRVVIQGSAPLALLGIVENVGDIDMVVSRSVYAHLKDELGWRETTHRGTLASRLQDRSKKFDAWLQWQSPGMEEPLSFSEAQKAAHKLKVSEDVGRILIGCPIGVKEYKEERGAKNDAKHLENIEEFLASHPAFILECMWARQLRKVDRIQDAVSSGRQLALDTAMSPVRSLVGAVTRDGDAA